MHEDGGPQVVLWVPPVGGAGGLAAGAEHAFVETIEQFSFLNRLSVLNVDVLLGSLTLQEWLDLLVLSVEVRHIDDQVFQDEHEHQGRDHTLLIVILGNTTEAGQVMSSIDIH